MHLRASEAHKVSLLTRRTKAFKTQESYAARFEKIIRIHSQVTGYFEGTYRQLGFAFLKLLRPHTLHGMTYHAMTKQMHFGHFQSVTHPPAVSKCTLSYSRRSRVGHEPHCPCLWPRTGVQGKCANQHAVMKNVSCANARAVAQLHYADENQVSVGCPSPNHLVKTEHAYMCSFDICSHRWVVLRPMSASGPQILFAARGFHALPECSQAYQSVLLLVMPDTCAGRMC
jgi:hypothetical protein